MAARPFWRALSITVVLGALSVGFTAAQDSPSSIVDSTGAPADHGSSDTTSPTQEVDVASTANDPTNPDTSIKMVGTPFPLRLDPAGYRIGPIHLTNVSTSGFYSIAAPVGQSSQTLVGTSIGGNFVYTHPVANGMVAIQANPTVYISPGSAYVNSIGGVDFSKQLTPRWSMTASAQWTFYQNEYLLQTPQYLLAYSAGGLVLQNIYAQRNGSTTYESNAFSMNYSLSGRTQLSLSPTVSTSFADVDGVSYLVAQLGGGGTLTHSFTPNRSGFVYGNLTRAFTTQTQGTGVSDWNTYSIGGGFNQKIGRTWFLSGSLGATQQTSLDSHWTPTGSATVMKTLKNGTISAAYSRSSAAATLLSSGYFDQADLAYVRQFGTKFGASMGLGVFRSIETTGHNHGSRANASLSYIWRRNLSWLFSYAYFSQESTHSTLYSGRTNYISAGLTWTLRQPAIR